MPAEAEISHRNREVEDANGVIRPLANARTLDLFSVCSHNSPSNRASHRGSSGVSVDYYVAVHQADWPTAAAMQTCMARRNYPVMLESAPTAPLDVDPGTGGLPLRFQGRSVQLEASVTRLSPTEFYAYSFSRRPDASIITPAGPAEIYAMRPDEAFEGRDINADLAELGAKNVKFGNGDFVLTLSFHSVSDETRAGLYLMAGLIHCFGGYGFEFQGGTHGTGACADELAADAADEKQWR